MRCVFKNQPMYVTFSFAFSFRCAKTQTFNFRKVMRQHTEGMMGRRDYFRNLPLSSSERILKIR